MARVQARMPSEGRAEGAPSLMRAASKGDTAARAAYDGASTVRAAGARPTTVVLNRRRGHRRGVRRAAMMACADGKSTAMACGAARAYM